jgi:hypothetical protein
MTNVAGSGVFELLRFSAVPVTPDVAVVHLEGRFSREGRFGRHPQLVVETPDGGSAEVPPVDTVEGEGLWRGTFAVRPRDLRGAGFALGVRGALLELPAPDIDESDRLASLAREANGLRRKLEAAEARARLAAAEVVVANDLRRDAAVEEATQRADAAQRALADAQSAARQAQTDALQAQARVNADAARRVEEAEAGAAAAVQDARAREASAAHDAEARVVAAQQQAASLRELLDGAHVELDEARRRMEEAHVEARDLRRHLKGARAELEAQRRRDARPAPVRARPVPTELVGIAGERDDGDDPPGPDDDPTVRQPVATAEPTTTVVNNNGEAVESVRVLGRAPRRTSPVPPAPDTDTLPSEEPSPLRWVAVGALVLFVVVLALLLF